MRVLFLTDNPTLGGTIRILQSWVRLGKGVDVEGYAAIPQGSKFARWLKAEGIEFSETPMPWPSRTRPIRGLWAAWRLARWARRRRVDVIHCNEHNVYPFALLVRFFLPRPIVCHVRYRIERPFARWAFGGKRQPDALLWTSHQQQSDCADAVRGIVSLEKQLVLPLGLNLSSFGNRTEVRTATREAWGFRPNEIVIGQACALRERKRVTEFIDLVGELARQDERVVGVLAGDAMPGDEQYRDRVLKHLESCGLGRRFRWLGNLDEVEPFYQALDVFVSTSEYETFGNSVCEAMACARPVAGYRGGSIHEVIGDAGVIIDDGDPVGLTTAVRELVQKPERRADLGRRGRDRVAEHFNPAHSWRRLVDLYRQLAGESNQSTVPVA